MRFFAPALTRLALAATALTAIFLPAALAVFAAQASSKDGGAGAGAVSKSYSPELVESGRSLFQQNCAFCHGKDAGGGETGPDLTRSLLVSQDVDGDRIGVVVRGGRPGKGMPAFNFTEPQIAGLAAFIHTQRNDALRQTGGRKGVEAADLQTGDAAAGERYFNGAGGCRACHSPTADLAGVASRYQGLKLEEQMLYPRHAKSRVTVTPAAGSPVTGALAYQDEFAIALIDASGQYRCWRTRDVRYKIDDPVAAHAELLPKYTDSDIHNLMAYLQTLR